MSLNLGVDWYLMVRNDTFKLHSHGAALEEDCGDS